MIHNIYKQRGETPLECITRFRQANKEYKDDKWTYMGRLDPMADGVLLAATGEDIKRKEEFLNLDKDYDFVTMFGFATDTYDVLGRVLRVAKVDDLNEAEIRKVVAVYEGKREQKYPAYSSRTVRGKPLHVLARAGELDEEDIPVKNIEIYKINFHKLDELSPKELLGRLLMDISKVRGDFRQHESLVLWKGMLTSSPNKIFLGKFSASVSSGTYIRGIVNDLGNTLGCGACSLSITRTRVGDYKIGDSQK